jgi:hypothetical protein
MFKRSPTAKRAMTSVRAAVAHEGERQSLVRKQKRGHDPNVDRGLKAINDTIPLARSNPKRSRAWSAIVIPQMMMRTKRKQLSD